MAVVGVLALGFYRPNYYCSSTTLLNLGNPTPHQSLFQKGGYWGISPNDGFFDLF